MKSHCEVHFNRVETDYAIGLLFDDDHFCAIYSTKGREQFIDATRDLLPMAVDTKNANAEERSISIKKILKVFGKFPRLYTDEFLISSVPIAKTVTAECIELNEKFQKVAEQEQQSTKKSACVIL